MPAPPPTQMYDGVILRCASLADLKPRAPPTCSASTTRTGRSATSMSPMKVARARLAICRLWCVRPPRRRPRAPPPAARRASVHARRRRRRRRCLSELSAALRTSGVAIGHVRRRPAADNAAGRRARRRRPRWLPRLPTKRSDGAAAALPRQLRRRRSERPGRSERLRAKLGCAIAVRTPRRPSTPTSERRSATSRGWHAGGGAGGGVLAT